MCTEQQKAVVESLPSHEDDCDCRFDGVVTQQSLDDENVRYAGTLGRSQNNRCCGFVPGYLHTTTGVYVISRFADGSPAPLHLLDGLPESWIEERGQDGHVIRTCPGIVSGFLRDGRFYTREEALQAAAH